ncbi:MAG: DUF799 domain-containing protein [Fibromonadaceae bacterium]|jgi:hypothetical protein|nr:DUF799 domain-containing protein [Fibromonadaceae bacterium]
MKYKLIFFAICSAFLFFGCSASKPPKIAVYPESGEFKKERPLTFLIMPPINKTNSVDAKDLFYAKMAGPIYGDGYYVFPPTLAMELMKHESIYDAEVFLDAPLNKFEELLGADAVLFTIIYDTDKSKLRREAMVDIEFIIKSTVTNKELYRIRGKYILDKSTYTLDELNKDMQNQEPAGKAGAIVYYGVCFIVDLVRTIFQEEADVSGKVSGIALGGLPRGVYPTSQPVIGVYKSFEARELEKNGSITVNYRKFKEKKK